MNFQKTNILWGWVVWLIASVVFVMTIEPTASFWDCGEFIASANGLEVGHPPGAPFWMLLARLSIIIAPAGFEAYAVNVLSALSSSFTILFLFWSVTHMAKKFADKSGELTKGKLIAIMMSGAVGALAYTFSDSFWFSAAEGEVYAMSSLFTAMVFWAILRWETVADRGGEMRWILLIAYLMGLSIGVHLLNLLAIPAIAFIYYFKRYQVTPKGFITTGVVSLVILGIVQVGIIQYFIKIAAWMELTFVNSFGLGFNTGTTFYAILVFGIIGGVIWFSRKKDWPVVNTLTLGVLVCLLGYSSFTMIVVRSSANTPMDENNPENLFTLLSYLNREQYGDRPLLYGQYFNTPTDDSNQYLDGADVYVKSYSVYDGSEKQLETFRWKHDAESFMAKNEKKNYHITQEYVESGEKKNSIPNYVNRYSGVLPRMYSSQANHIGKYKEWSNYKGWNEARRGKKVRALEKNLSEKESDYRYGVPYQMSIAKSQNELRQLQSIYGKLPKQIDRLRDKLKPSAGEDMRFMMRYQFNWMYWRYFMWNFAGKQNDTQGHGSIQNGNWISGLDFIDAEKLGNRESVTDRELNNKAHNHFFLIPLLLGLMGLIFQFVRSPKDFFVVALLFVLTGIAIVVYLNQYPMQPRERDYAFVGSFYAFAIWIGLGVYALYYAATNMNWLTVGKIALGSFGASVLVFLLEFVGGGDHVFSYSLFYMSFVSVAAFALMTILNQTGINNVAKATIAGALCLIGPIIQANDGWDDHSRAKRKTGVDFAKNYLDSLAPNAIIFTNGDNDTFPLWYVQEVEGYRTDVRVVNLSLLNTDWYIDQMKRKAYNSDAVPFIMPEQKYRQGTRDIVLLDHKRNTNDDYIDVKRAIDICLDDDINTEVGDGRVYQYLPTYKFSLPVDTSFVLQNGTVRPQDADKIVSELRWSITESNGRGKQYILKNAFMVLDLLANNEWKRPIYFAVTTGQDSYIGLSDYFQLEGLAYRLVPIKAPKSQNPNVLGTIASDLMYDNVMNKFQWGNMDDTTGVYMDENNRRMITNLRLQFSNLAEELIATQDEGKALEILNKCIDVMPEKNAPYDRVMLPLVESYMSMSPRDSLRGGALQDSSMTLAQRTEALEKGKQLTGRLFDIFENELEYFYSLEPEYARSIEKDMSILLQVNARMQQVISFYAPEDPMVEELATRLDQLYSRYEEKIKQLERKAGTPGEF